MNELSLPLSDLGIIIAAGGSGSRFGEANKLLSLLRGKPVFCHSLRHFASLCPPDALVLVVPENEMETFSCLARTHCPDIFFRLCGGGSSRGRSVSCGLRILPAGVEYVAIHDAARPLTSAALLLRCLDEARLHGGAIVARPVTDTLKQGDVSAMVAATVDRSALWSVETPQIFRLAWLKQAYAMAKNQEFTDDAGVMEAAGYAVKLVENTNPNIKITYARDLLVAEALLSFADSR